MGLLTEISGLKSRYGKWWRCFYNVKVIRWPIGYAKQNGVESCVLVVVIGISNEDKIFENEIDIRTIEWTYFPDHDAMVP
jgi:hypothetical protein